MRNIYPVLGLIAATAAMNFSYTQNVNAKSANDAESQNISAPAITEIQSASKQKTGPHGAYDPHVNLSADKLVQVALQHRAEGRPGEAMAVLDQAISNHVKHAGLLAVRGSILLEQGKVSAALRDLGAAIELKPDDPLTRTNRAQAYRQFGRIQEALTDLDQAIKLNPDLIAARFNRGAIHYSSGAFEQALADFEHCIAVEPHMSAPYFNRASTYYALGKREAAIADLNRFLEIADSEDWKKAAQDLIKKWQADAATSTEDPA